MKGKGPLERAHSMPPLADAYGRGSNERGGEPVSVLPGLHKQWRANKPAAFRFRIWIRVKLFSGKVPQVFMMSLARLGINLRGAYSTFVSLSYY